MIKKREKINVLYVSHFSDLSMGGQRSMTHLIEHLDRDKFTPFAVCPRPGELSEKLESIGCRTFFVPFVSLKPKNLFKSFKITPLLKQIIRGNNIGIVHPDYPSDTFLSWLAVRGTGVKLVWHVRWTGRAAKDKLYWRLPDGIIGVSDAAGRRFFKEPFPAKYRTIYNGADIDVFKPVENKQSLREKLRLPADKFILLFAGVLKDGKGIYDIAEAVSILKQNGEEVPYTVFVGKAPSEEKLVAFKEFIKGKGISPETLIAGRQTNAHEWMAAADALALPSHEGNEGMPRALCEALACGIPGIGSDTSGVNEAVTPESGLLVPEKSPKELAAAIKRLMDDPELRRKMGQAGRRRALENFDIRIHARKVEDFYDFLLG
ncbi:MAG: glycosyltransferase family 4 protein [Chloroflexota bacterium]